jgi:hypothetical protein
VPLRESVIDTVERVTTDPDQPLHQRAYRSPLRDERLAAWLGAPLGILFAICFVTGLFSHIQQHPLKWLPVPARPAGLYRVTQGIHVISGIAAVPFLFAKLWVVWPRFVSVPPFRRVSDVVERLGILALVGGGVFMVFSGVADIAQWYPWRFSFTASHYWAAWITIGAILAHLGAKWHIVRRSLRQGADMRSADPTLGTTAEEPHPGLTRRGFLATVVGASGALVLVTAGQTVPALRRLALLAPRNPASQPINKSAANAGVLQSARSADYRLTVGGRVSRPLSLTMDELMALPSHQAELPIACVEGWSYSARWRGVRLADVMAMAGAPPDAAAQVVSLERNSPYTVSFVNHFQAHDHDTLLATHLDGSPLSLDHGYPLRLIGPDRPGVNQTKWVTRIVVV